jgi:putative effector of murein hydrolase LrgA (UPF0299 family)
VLAELFPVNKVCSVLGLLFLTQALKVPLVKVEDVEPFVLVKYVD